MNHLSEPMRLDPQPGLAYKTIASGKPEALLLLLHGVGGNESQLESLALQQDLRILSVLPRAPLTFGPANFGWFEVSFGPQGPAINPDQAEESRRQLVRLVGNLQRETGIDAERTVVAGFSQGGIMSASLGLTRPDLVVGFGLMSGRILPEIAPELAPPGDLRRLSGFISHGLQDNKLPVLWADRADAWLRDLGVSFESRRYPAGHELTSAMAGDFRAWLAKRLWP